MTYFSINEFFETFTKVSREPKELINFDVYRNADWDGEGACAVPDTVFHLAESIARILPSAFPTGSAMAGINGSIGLFWASSEAKIYIDVLADLRVRYISQIGGALDLSGILSADVNINNLLKILKESISLIRYPKTYDILTSGSQEFIETDQYSTSIEFYKSSLELASNDEFYDKFIDSVAHA